MRCVEKISVFFPQFECLYSCCCCLSWLTSTAFSVFCFQRKNSYSFLAVLSKRPRIPLNVVSYCKFSDVCFFCCREIYPRVLECILQTESPELIMSKKDEILDSLDQIANDQSKNKISSIYIFFYMNVVTFDLTLN